LTKTYLSYCVDGRHNELCRSYVLQPVNHFTRQKYSGIQRSQPHRWNTFKSVIPIPTAHVKFHIIPTVPHRQILRASFEPKTRTLRVPYIAKGNKNLFRLHVLEGIAQESDAPHAERWVESLMKTIYEGKSQIAFLQYPHHFQLTQMVALNVQKDYWF